MEIDVNALQVLVAEETEALAFCTKTCDWTCFWTD
jgi:hypothetical protein